jgi:hypothetical protein
MAERSARLMAKAERAEVSLYISLLVLAEVIWVLKSFYRYSMTAIARVVIALVSASGIEVDLAVAGSHGRVEATEDPQGVIAAEVGISADSRAAADTLGGIVNVDEPDSISIAGLLVFRLHGAAYSCSVDTGRHLAFNPRA